MPELPARLDRYAIDAHYTTLVNTLRGDGSPAAAAERAHHLFLEQFRAAHPQVEVPPFLQHLGLPEEAPDAPQQTQPNPTNRSAETTPSGEDDSRAESDGGEDGSETNPANPQGDGGNHPGEPCATVEGG